MKTIPLLRLTAFRPVLDFARSSGLPADAHFEAVGAPTRGFDELDRLVPERALWVLLDRLRRTEGIEDVGFRVGSSQDPVALPDIAPLLSGHPSLQRTLRAFCESLRAHNNLWQYWTEPTSGGLRLSRRNSLSGDGAWPIEQYALSYMVDVVRLAAPSDWWPSHITLQRSGPLSEQERTWLGNAEVRLGSPVTSFTIPQELLAKRPRKRIPGPRPVSGVDVFGVDLVSRDLVTAYREVLRNGLLTERTHLSQVARQLGVQERTLQRTLARAGVSHRELLEEVRREAVCTELEDSDRPIADIARALGYRHHQALSQAFKRWTGVSPTAYRRANRDH